LILFDIIAVIYSFICGAVNFDEFDYF